MKILKFLKKSLLRKIYSANKGFTLVELLVVIAIIAILAGIVTPNAFNAIEKAKVAKAEADYRAIKSAALNYYTDTGTWPNGNNDFLIAPSGVSGWNGPYLEKWPEKNPWGGTYTFRNASSSTPWGDINARWLELTNVTNTVYSRLQSDLGPDTVILNKNTLSILISKD